MRHTKKEALNQMMFQLFELGFAADEAQALHGIAMTLSRWDEAECNGDIQRDEETGKPYRTWEVFEPVTHHRKARRFPCADREAGAMKRLAKILSSHPELAAYRQTDPRGCSLYVYYKVKSLYSLQTIDRNYSSIGIAVF